MILVMWTHPTSDAGGNVSLDPAGFAAAINLAEVALGTFFEIGTDATIEIL